MEFEAFSKIPRLNRDCVITEKIDGTNAAVVITPWVDGENVDSRVATVGNQWSIYAQSRKRFITPQADNFGFARWVQENAEALVRVLGEGRHFGEWWGKGIQRGYGLDHKRFSLFNTDRWSDLDGDWHGVSGLGVVPVVYRGLFSTDQVETAVSLMRRLGSFAAPGFTDPEGVIVWHEAARQMFKVTCKDDEKPKGQN